MGRQTRVGVAVWGCKWKMFMDDDSDSGGGGDDEILMITFMSEHSLEQLW